MLEPEDRERYFELLKAHVVEPREEHLPTAAGMGEDLTLAGLPAKVLVVDDEPSVLSSIRRLLVRKGLEVATTSSAQEALDMLRQEEYAVVIADQRMPVVSGTQLLGQVREVSPDTVRILLTGYPDVETAIESIYKGAVYRFLTKPWNDQELGLAVRQAVEQFELTAENRRLQKLSAEQNKELRALNRRIGERLKTSQEKFEAIVAKGSDGVLVVNQDGAVKYANPAAATLLNRKEQGLLGSTFGLPMAAGGVTDMDIVRTCGGTGTAEMRVAETVWNGETVYLVLLHDVTEHKELQEELSRAKRTAEAANRAKSEFLANMSHELRTPLNAIIGFSEGLLARADQHPLNEHQKDRIAKMLQSGRNLLALVNSVLDIAQIEAGHAERHIETFALRPLAEEVASTALELVRLKDGVTFVLDLSGDVSLLTSDRDKVRQILLNLLSNAVKFTDQGSVTLRIRRRSGSVDMSVEDTGIGIPADQFHRIFEQFHRAHATARPAIGGTGLGLSLSKSLAEFLGGQLTFESVEGHGSEFTLALPFTPPDVEATEQQEVAEPAQHV